MKLKRITGCSGKLVCVGATVVLTGCVLPPATEEQAEPVAESVATAAPVDVYVEPRPPRRQSDRGSGGGGGGGWSG
jgi:hypothetical protein